MKKKRITQRSRGLVGIILLTIVVLFSGCASMQITTMHYSTGRILLLPPRDVVQQGEPHPKGVDSGHIFQGYLKDSFANRSLELLTTDNAVFNNTEIAEKAAALEEGKRLGVDYCLQVVLGDFLNAAPFSFRPDHANLDKAIMYDVKSGNTVWEITSSSHRQKSNIGNHLILLKQHADTLAKSIHENMK